MATKTSKPTKKSRVKEEQPIDKMTKENVIDERIKVLFTGEQVVKGVEFADRWKALTHLENSLKIMDYKHKKILRDELQFRTDEHLKKRALEVAKDKIKSLKHW